MIKTFCDRCKEEVYKRNLFDLLIEEVPDYAIARILKGKFILCGKCHRELKKWLWKRD